MRFLFKFTLPTAFNPCQRSSVRVSPEYESPFPLWLSISLPPNPIVAVTISRGSTPLTDLIYYKSVYTEASALGPGPAHVAVRTQINKKRKRSSDNNDDECRDLSAYRDYDDKSSDDEIVLPTLEPTPSKSRRVSLSSLRPLLMTPASARPKDAVFSMGQAVWAEKMLEALISGENIASKPTHTKFLISAVRSGARQVEKELAIGFGMEGVARAEQLGMIERLLWKLGCAGEESGLEDSGDGEEEDFVEESEEE